MEGRITEDESDSIERTDLILRGPSGWALVEVSTTVHSYDLTRAQIRARLLSRAVSGTVVPAVIGRRISGKTLKRAAEHEVEVLLYKPKNYTDKGREDASDEINEEIPEDMKARAITFVKP